MTAPVEPTDGGLRIDPAIARILLRHREAIAQATERAYRELADLGVTDPTPLLLGRGIHTARRRDR
jgi:hypothetical protein